jgi:hypothetical protein
MLGAGVDMEEHGRQRRRSVTDGRRDGGRRVPFPVVAEAGRRGYPRIPKAGHDLGHHLRIGGKVRALQGLTLVTERAALGFRAPDARGGGGPVAAMPVLRKTIHEKHAAQKIMTQ